MALRDQPYIPLYIQDFLTDEKLIECSAESTGVYIRLMCIMHKSDEYGTILLRQKDKQNSNNCLNFANKLAKHFPYSISVIENSLTELVNEGVLTIEGDKLIQKRMVNDNRISMLRSKSGKKGAEQRYLNDDFANTFANTFATAKPLANSEYENETENESKIEYKKIKVYAKNCKVERDRIVEDKILLEPFAMHRRCEMDEIFKLLDLFITSNAFFEKEWESEQEFRKHFMNWMNKKPTLEKPKLPIKSIKML